MARAATCLPYAIGISTEIRLSSFQSPTLVAQNATRVGHPASPSSATRWRPTGSAYNLTSCPSRMSSPSRKSHLEGSRFNPKCYKLGSSAQTEGSRSVWVSYLASPQVGRGSATTALFPVETSEGRSSGYPRRAENILEHFLRRPGLEDELCYDPFVWKAVYAHIENLRWWRCTTSVRQYATA